MDQTAMSIKKERVEIVNTAPVPAMDTAKTTAKKHAKPDNIIDLTGEGDDGHGSDEPRPIKAETAVTPEIIEINSPQLNATQSQDTGKGQNGPGSLEPLPVKAETIGTPEVVEIHGLQLNPTRMQDTRNENNDLGFVQPRPIKAGPAATPEIVEVESFPIHFATGQNTEDIPTLSIDSDIIKKPEMSSIQIQSVENRDIISTTMESDVHSINSYSSGSEDDDEEKDGTYQEGSGRSRTNRKRDRRPMAKNPREFFAMQQEKQKRLRQKQAKGNSKTNHGSRKGKAPGKMMIEATSELGMVAQLQQDVRNGENVRESAATSMPEMSTCTHAEQLAIIRNSIPEGSDNRRSKTQKRDLQQAVKSFGYKVLKAHDGNWLHKDMETALYSYQVTATSWMMQRELVKAGPAAGGIIADEMGMGKTLMSLACVAGNPPEDGDLKKFTRSTLIIVPNKDVADQWLEEAKRHLCSNIRKWVKIYDAKSDTPDELFQIYWIIITTLNEVKQQFNSFEKNQKSHQLFALKWYRIILDEAHAIKSIYSKNKEACCSLKAKYRWALTGTPLSNNTTEFLPYLKFIGCNIAEDVRAFKREFMLEKRANQKLEALISTVMYRRTKNDTFLGHKILSIPKCHTHDIHFRISQEEDVFYDFIKSIFEKVAESLEKDALVKIEEADDVSSAELEANLRSELLHIRSEENMQLRMVLSHPYNIENILRTMATGAEIQRLRQALVEKGKKRTVLQQLFEDEKLVAELKPYRSGVEMMKKCAEGALGGQFDFDICLNMMQIEREAKESKCAACAETPEMAVKATKCGHFYCNNCYLKKIQGAMMTDDGHAIVNACSFRQCRHPILVTAHSSSMEKEVWQASHDGKFVEPGIDFNHVSLPRPDERNGCFILGRYRRDVSHIPSSRLTVAMCVLGSWLADYPRDKIMGKVLGLMLQEAKVPFLYYYGCMSATSKTQALETFKDEATPSLPKVLLVSLKSGGQSLNLACANRIIIIDPWWNVTAEQQAIGRAHRIGQTKECHVVRVWTESHMDEKIRGLQTTKSAEVNYALQDDGHMPMLLDDDQRDELYNFPTSEKKGNGKQKTVKPAKRGRKQSKRQEANSGGRKRRRRC
ncbi:hypothetical protein E4U43_001142 [Claviceps pusilla]|uniref:Uncharacterized protein n=1 Tax=Claviceps pusilla TaxID=123648 RepID=A0A9P7NH35_9HYPO|nr:hypothetical protein E4U43_001142 [Claviceps pusilla]